MPSSIFSHQAPGLLIKIIYPKWFDGAALCISTLVPDLNILFDPFSTFDLRNISHSLIGLVVFTLPVTLLLTILFSRFIGPFLGNIAKKENRIYKPLRFYGLDSWDNFKTKKFNKRFFIVASYSALVGGFIHLLLDLPAHEHVQMFFPLIFQNPDFLLYSIVDYGTFNLGPFVIDADLTVYQLIWFIETVIFFGLSLYLLRYTKKHNLIENWYKKTIQENKEYGI
jgi:membrane-bound metal-dependent hydrolase YbcI (DUF457 family)